jgi:hypothetical protein
MMAPLIERTASPDTFYLFYVNNFIQATGRRDCECREAGVFHRIASQCRHHARARAVDPPKGNQAHFGCNASHETDWFPQDSFSHAEPNAEH